MRGDAGEARARGEGRAKSSLLLPRNAFCLMSPSNPAAEPMAPPRTAPDPFPPVAPSEAFGREIRRGGAQATTVGRTRSGGNFGREMLDQRFRPSVR